VPTHQSRALWTAWAPPPPAATIAAGWDDRGGLDRRAADDGGLVQHDPEPRRPAEALLSGKAHAVPTRASATAADAVAIIRDMCLRSGDGFPDVLVVDHDPKFTSEVFRAFVKGPRAGARA
jgi:hypothetical protein